MAASPVAVRLYSMLARVVLPTNFRRQYGRAMVDAFDDMYRDAGSTPPLWTMAREMGFLIGTAFTVRGEMRRERRNQSQSHRSRPGAWGLPGLTRDLRYATRAMRRQPGFAAFAIVTLALGIGTNTAIFSVVKTVLLQPPPFPEPERIVGVFETALGFGQRGVTSPAYYRDWAERSDVFEAIAAIRGMRFHLNSHGEPERQFGRAVSPAFFRVMGVAPMLGRPLVDGDDRPGTRIVVLGHGLWQRQFGGDSSAVGSDIVLNGEPHTVVGVMPPGFDHPNGTEIWTPLIMDPEMWGRRGWYFLTAIARLRVGVTLEQAQARMDGVAAQQLADFPDSRANRGIHVERVHDVEVSRVRSNLWMLFGSVGLVLLIACTNVANLMLSRAVARTREISLRAALGADRRQILRQLLVESGVLGVAGGVAGVFLASAGLKLFVALSPQWFPRVEHVQIDTTVLAYTLGISLATSLLFGIVPALRLSGVATADAMRAMGGGLNRRSLRLGNVLVVGETALAIVLLLGAGLLLRSFHRLTAQPLGFDPTNVLAVEVPLPDYTYSEASEQAEFYSRLVERARGMPGVVDAAATNTLPFGLSWYGAPLTLETGDADGREVDAYAASHRVSPGYFETLRLPLQLGRTLQAADREGNTPVAVVNEAFVDEFLSGLDPLRARIRIYDAEAPFQIVGVVGNAKHRGLDDKPEPAAYFSMRQRPAGSMMVFLRADTDPLNLTTAITNHVRELDPTVPITRMSTMDQFISDSLAQPRFYAVLLSIFAGTALILACIGVYGVLSFQVAQRTHEIGIRMALGARSDAVLRLVIGRGLALVVPGVVIGLGAGYALTSLLDSLLYEITPTDPLTFGGLTVLFLVIAGLASYVPARRGTRVDPVRALRSD